MLKLFTTHPSTVGESYWQHMAFACKFGVRMIAGGFACFVHGFFPFLFPTTGSRMVKKLAHKVHNRGDDAPIISHSAISRD